MEDLSCCELSGCQRPPRRSLFCGSPRGGYRVLGAVRLAMIAAGDTHLASTPPGDTQSLQESSEGVPGGGWGASLRWRALVSPRNRRRCEPWAL